MSVDKKNIEDYFDGKGSISIIDLSFNKSYQKEFVEYSANHFDNAYIKNKIVESFAMLNTNNDKTYSILERIALHYNEIHGKPIDKIIRSEFANSVAQFLKNNTSRSDSNILDITGKVYNSMDKSHQNIFIEEDDADFLIKNSTSKLKADDPFRKKPIQIQSNKKHKNLNPTKVANICIQQGIPENLDELTYNINKNISFPKALLTSMANIASIMEMKGDMSVEKRTNYFKVFKLLKDEDIEYGFKLFIDNFKNMSESDRLIIRFFYIWEDVLKSYKNMNGLHKDLVLRTLKRETDDAFENYRKMKEEDKKLREQNIPNVSHNDFDIDNADISEINIRKEVERISDFYMINKTMNDNISNILNDQHKKIFFLKQMILNSTAQIVKNNNNNENGVNDKKTEASIRAMLMILVMDNIDIYEKTFFFFLKSYHKMSATYLSYRIKILISRVLIDVLKVRYGDDAAEVNMYSKVTTKMIMSKKYIT